MNDDALGRGYHGAFCKDKLTLGIGFPIEAYTGSIAQMEHQIARAKQVEKGGFSILWTRDIPILDPSFGDLGQIYDPWVWLGFVAAQTTTIALGTGSIILPLRARVDLAKAAASVDELSQGRLIFGVATGDRPVEYSVFQQSFENRDENFRETFDFIRDVSKRPANWNNQHAALAQQLDVLPKSHAGRLPMFVTGHSRQTLDWIAEKADGWLMYPRPLAMQQATVNDWLRAVQAQGDSWKPFAQSLYIDLTEDADTPPKPIHLGFRLGRHELIKYLDALQTIGVNHVLLNVKFSSRPIDEVLSELCEFVAPRFKRLVADAEL